MFYVKLYFHKIFSHLSFEVILIVYGNLILMAWLFMSFKIIFDICFRLLQYIGRETAPSPATGNKATHKKELKEFLDKAMSL